jgi:hypothetical protein
MSLIMTAMNNVASELTHRNTLFTHTHICVREILPLHSHDTCLEEMVSDTSSQHVLTLQQFKNIHVKSLEIRNPLPKGFELGTSYLDLVLLRLLVTNYPREIVCNRTSTLTGGAGWGRSLGHQARHKLITRVGDSHRCLKNRRKPIFFRKNKTQTNSQT